MRQNSSPSRDRLRNLTFWINERKAIVRVRYEYRKVYVNKHMEMY